MLTKLLSMVLISIAAASSGPPIFEKRHEDVGLVEGYKSEVWCRASGDEPLQYTWHDRFSKEIFHDTEHSVYSLATADGSALVFNVADLNHADFYTCSAKNKYGLNSKIYNISVYQSTKNKTDELVGIHLVNIKSITDTSVKFSIIATGKPVVRFSVKYIEKVENQSRTLNFPSGDVIEVNGLIPSGSYQFQFMALSDLSDVGNWSSVHNVVLLPEAPELIFRSIGGGNLKICWFRKFNDSLRETIDEYKLSYSSVSQMRGNYWVYNNCITNVTIPACAVPCHGITGLSKVSHYEISLVAHTKSGYGKSTNFKAYVE